MSLFNCEECGVVENTALCFFWSRNMKDAPQKGRKLCSQCDPQIQRWHGRFERRFDKIEKK